MILKMAKQKSKKVSVREKNRRAEQSNSQWDRNNADLAYSLKVIKNHITRFGSHSGR